MVLRRVFFTLGYADLLPRGFGAVSSIGEAVCQGPRRRGPSRPFGRGHLQGRSPVADRDGSRVRGGAEDRPWYEHMSGDRGAGLQDILKDIADTTVEYGSADSYLSHSYLRS